jgi:hypothetical protein
LSRSPDLAAAIDIPRWLRDDRVNRYAERRARDGAIGRQLQATTPAGRVLGWWARIGADGSGDRIARLVGLGVLLLAATGLVIGAATAAIAFAYEGEHPVNLFALLGVLVVIPAILLLLTICLLPGRVPGLGALQDLASGLNPGYWFGGWLDRRFGTELFARIGSGGAAGSLARWQLAAFSQWLAIGFFAGALGAGVLLVAFTDLAFGWSTTLEVDSDRIHRLFVTLATPWAGWLPSAVPDAELVQTSRFFRLEHAAVPADRAAALGSWWPFVLMTVTVYGLAPRLALLAIATWRRRSATRQLLLSDPEVMALLDRLAGPAVEIRGEHDAPIADSTTHGATPPPRAADADALAIVWNRAVTAADAARWLAGRNARPPRAVIDIDARDDVATMGSRLAKEAQGARRVWIFVKGWEPPLLEFFDVLQAARTELGTIPFAVVPIAVNGATVGPGERELWAQGCARPGLEGVYVVEAEVADTRHDGARK